MITIIRMKCGRIICIKYELFGHHRYSITIAVDDLCRIYRFELVLPDISYGRHTFSALLLSWRVAWSAASLSGRFQLPVVVFHNVIMCCIIQNALSFASSFCFIFPSFVLPYININYLFAFFFSMMVMMLMTFALHAMNMSVEIVETQ